MSYYTNVKADGEFVPIDQVLRKRTREITLSVLFSFSLFYTGFIQDMIIKYSSGYESVLMLCSFTLFVYTDVVIFMPQRRNLYTSRFYACQRVAEWWTYVVSAVLFLFARIFLSVFQEWVGVHLPEHGSGSVTDSMRLYVLLHTVNLLLAMYFFAAHMRGTSLGKYSTTIVNSVSFATIIYASEMLIPAGGSLSPMMYIAILSSIAVTLTVLYMRVVDELVLNSAIFNFVIDAMLKIAIFVTTQSLLSAFSRHLILYVENPSRTAIPIVVMLVCANVTGAFNASGAFSHNKIIADKIANITGDILVGLNLFVASAFVRIVVAGTRDSVDRLIIVLMLLLVYVFATVAEIRLIRYTFARLHATNNNLVRVLTLCMNATNKFVLTSLVRVVVDTFTQYAFMRSTALDFFWHIVLPYTFILGIFFSVPEIESGAAIPI